MNFCLKPRSKKIKYCVYSTLNKAQQREVLSTDFFFQIEATHLLVKFMSDFIEILL